MNDELCQFSITVTELCVFQTSGSTGILSLIYETGISYVTFPIAISSNDYCTNVMEEDDSANISHLSTYFSERCIEN